MDIKYWNNLVKPLECDATAVEGDIVSYIDGVYFLCQTTHHCNNVIAFSYEYDIKHIKTMIKFIISLYEEHSINYIRIEGSHNRYQLLKRVVPLYVLQDKEILIRDVYYMCLCNESIEQLKNIN